jgi:hypothetical protein
VTLLAFWSTKEGFWGQVSFETVDLFGGVEGYGGAIKPTFWVAVLVAMLLSLSLYVCRRYGREIEEKVK